MKCSERNLECDTKGSDVLLAHPKSGFYRLGNETKAVQCLEPKERCSPETRKQNDLKSDDNQSIYFCFGFLCGIKTALIT